MIFHLFNVVQYVVQYKSMEFHCDDVAHVRRELLQRFARSHEAPKRLQRKEIFDDASKDLVWEFHELATIFCGAGTATHMAVRRNAVHERFDAVRQVGRIFCAGDCAGDLHHKNEYEDIFFFGGRLILSACFLCGHLSFALIASVREAE